LSEGKRSTCSLDVPETGQQSRQPHFCSNEVDHRHYHQHLLIASGGCPRDQVGDDVGGHDDDDDDDHDGDFDGAHHLCLGQSAGDGGDARAGWSSEELLRVPSFFPSLCPLLPPRAAAVDVVSLRSDARTCAVGLS